MCVFVLPIEVQPFSFLSNTLLLIDWYELPFLILSSTPVLGLPGGLLPSTLPSITIGRRSPWRNVCPSQALCLLSVVDIIDFSSSTRRSTLSLLTLSDQEMFRIFLQSHISQLHNFRISSLLNAQDWAPYSSVLQMTVLTVLFFRPRLKDFVQFFPVWERNLCPDYSRCYCCCCFYCFKNVYKHFTISKF